VLLVHGYGEHIGRYQHVIDFLNQHGFEVWGYDARGHGHSGGLVGYIPTIDALPQGAVVGTSSLRRVALLRAIRPDLKIEPLRGNLDTRLRKLDDGLYDGIILAAAGLKRLGLASRIAQVFEPAYMLPAAGQGALGIEIPSDREDVAQALSHLLHMPTFLAVSAERMVSRLMGGSCSMPLAAHATFTDHSLELHAAWGDPEGVQPLVLVNGKADVHTLTQAEALGTQVAQALQAGVAQQTH
jgi:hydroxymethylbilane synthase